jgi:hypothetical protein
MLSYLSMKIFIEHFAKMYNHLETDELRERLDTFANDLIEKNFVGSDTLQEEFRNLYKNLKTRDYSSLDGGQRSDPLQHSFSRRHEKKSLQDHLSNRLFD